MNRTGLPGLYVHIPFCKTKCPYCDFYSVTDTSLIDRWLGAVLREARLYAGFGRFDSLYIGGGTPSCLDDRQISGLIASLRGIFPFTDDTEITIEINPDDGDPEKLNLYKTLGINRVSIGVQSFVEEEVRFLGRRHTARQAISAVEAVRRAGFKEMSIDLMYGLPGQSVEGWLGTLRQAVSFGPDHLSCYQLTLEGDTPFSRMAGQGRLTMPDNSLQADFFIGTSEHLAASGFAHYEVSNFAYGPEKLARHNVKYWQHTRYLGLGPAAHSFDGEKRWWNIRDVDAYLACMDCGTAPMEGSESLSSSQVNLEKLLFGFRTMWGIDVQEITPPPSPECVSGLCEAGFVTFDGRLIIPLLKGYLFADRLPLMIT